MLNIDALPICSKQFTLPRGISSVIWLAEYGESSHNFKIQSCKSLINAKVNK